MTLFIHDTINEYDIICEYTKIYIITFMLNKHHYRNDSVA